MNPRILLDATQDVDEIDRQLDEHRPGLGIEFLLLYRDAILSIAAAPRQHSPTEDGPDGIETREVYISRFKQRVIYAVVEAEVVVLAVVHAHRRPGSWLGRAEQI